MGLKTPSLPSDTLLLQLKTLRLSGILVTLEARHRQAIASEWSYVEFLSRLLEDEIERRAQKQLDVRLRRGAINTTKTLEDFSFAFNPNINRQQVMALAACDFIRDKRNVLLCGPAGVGKSHLAQALGQQACRQGFNVLFISTHKMLQHLLGGRADNSYERRLATYLRPDLLILDDFGLRSLVPPAPDDLYEVINERYEKGSILLTSNRSPKEWATLFNDPLLASAGIDRLGDRAEMLVIRGQSYRSHGRTRTGMDPSTSNERDSQPSQKEEDPPAAS
jgi:DNA replication protein DnaC